MLQIRYLLIILFSLFSLINAQTNNGQSQIKVGENWFFNVNYGYQVSGIKNEDFVHSNYTPLFNISMGKFMTQLGKRITFYCLPYNQNKLRYFEYLLEMKETRVIPLYKNINLRSLSNIITRWRELVLYFHSILLLYLKSNNRDDIQKYFLKKSQHKYLSISYNYRKFPNSV